MYAKSQRIVRAPNITGTLEITPSATCSNPAPSSNLMPSPTSPRAKRLWQLYRLTEEEYNAILAHQGGVCPITGRLPGRVALNVDHCHETGLIRGLLSPLANKGLAYFNDDPYELRAAATYLESPPAPVALGRKVFGLLGQARRKKVMVYGSN